MAELQHKLATTAAAREEEADAQDFGGETREELHARQVILEDEVKVCLLDQLSVKDGVADGSDRI